MKNTLAFPVLSLILVPVVLAAPALCGDKSGTKGGSGPSAPPASAELVPGMRGEGSGTWRAPEKAAGRLRATSSLGTKGPNFAFDAAIVRQLSKNPDEAVGTLSGEMLLLDPVSGARAVAVLAGEWKQDLEGIGIFAARLLSPDKSKGGAMETIGVVSGTFKTDPKDPSVKGPVILRWSVTQ